MSTALGRPEQCCARSAGLCKTPRVHSQENVALPLFLTPAGGGLGAARTWGCS